MIAESPEQTDLHGALELRKNCMEGNARVTESRRFYLAERPGDPDLDLAPSHRHTAVSVAQWKRPQDAVRPDAADRQVVRQGKVRGGCGLRVGVQEIELKQGCICRHVEIELAAVGGGIAL
jgi:hypothetical protein